MANKYVGVKFSIIRTSIVLVVLLSAVTLAKAEEGSLFEFAESLLKESVRNQNSGGGLNLLSGLVQGFMQTEGGKQLGDMLTKGKGGQMDLISNLASIWQASKFNLNTKVQGSDGKGDINIDPAMLGSMVDLLSSLSKATNDADNNNVDENNNDKKEIAKPTEDEASFNWDAIVSFAGTLISSVTNKEGGGSSGGIESFLSFLPVLMNSLTGQHNTHSSHAIPHHSHTPFLPPFLENIHEYWDHFSKSEFGRTLWENSGLSELVKAFSNDRGEIQTDKVFESLENNTFRRKWIKSISSFVAEWVKHFTDVNIQKSYLETGQVICNGFLQSQGYGKDTFLDLNKPAKSISKLINAVFKRQFDMKVNSETYVEPVVNYIQEMFKVGQRSGFGVKKLSTADIEAKLSATIDSDLLEPIIRSNRAYKFALRRPNCSKYVICAINDHPDIKKGGLKPGVIKLSSLGASWFLSGRNNLSFWSLYSAAVDEKPCRMFDQSETCSEFHAEDIKATTEYYHNEL